MLPHFTPTRSRFAHYPSPWRWEKGDLFDNLLTAGAGAAGVPASYEMIVQDNLSLTGIDGAIYLIPVVYGISHGATLPGGAAECEVCHGVIIEERLMSVAHLADDLH